MIEYLESLDRAIVLAVNGINTPFLDEFMWWISARITWVPLYVFLLYLVYRKTNLKTTLIYFALVGLTIIIADAVSVYGLKEMFQRYRPSHNSFLTDKLHFYKTSATDVYMGGKYGFVSSHATNFFVITTLFALVFYKSYPKVTYFLVFISVLVCFSRIYLGVHYISDLIGGAILGGLLAYLAHRFIWKRMNVDF